MDIQVPTIACEGCAATITNAIQSQIPEAIISVDMATKTVTITPDQPVALVKNIIVEAGHKPA